MTTGGKGDKPRPFSVPLSEYDNNWDRIFGKRKQKHPTSDDLSAYDEERLVSKYDKESGKTDE